METLKKAKIYDPDDPTKYTFYVQFNPSTIQVSQGYSKQSAKGVNAEKNAGGAQEKQLQGNPLEAAAGLHMSVKLFYNTYESASSFEDVRSKIKQFYYFQSPVSQNNSVVNHRIAFAWGSITIIGKLTSFHVSYEMFAPSGVPVRAEVTVEIDGDDPDRAAAAIDQQEAVSITGDATAWRQAGALPANIKALFSGWGN